MIRNHAVHFHRLTAFLLMLAMLMTSCFTPAFAANIWDSLTLNILWTDGRGEVQTYPAQPVPNSAERAYWVSLPSSAIGQELTLQADCPDARYSFFLYDEEWGEQTTSFFWLPEKDAAALTEDFAHQVYYTVDGIMGDMPVYLYISSMPMPENEEFVSFPVQVPVYYVTEDGQPLDTQYAECWAGETTTVWASSRNTQGYVLSGSDAAEVTVSKEGYASPSEVYFVYRQNATPTPEPTDEPTPEPTEVPTPTPVAEAPVLVLYYHVNGEQLDYQEIFLAPGTHVIEPNSRKVSDYRITGDRSATITIYPDGTASMGSIVFQYEDKEPEATPVVVNVPVSYIHIDRGILDTQVIPLSEGTHVVHANSSKTGDYIPVGSTAVEVAVYKDGSTHPGAVEFYYEDAYTEPVTAKLNIIYQNARGEIVLRDSMTLTPGSHTITPDAGRNAGLTLDGDQSYVVHVSENGAISPETIVFTLRQEAAVVTVHYQDERGRDVAPVQTYSFTEDDTYPIIANPEGLADNYEPVPGLHTEMLVTVKNGVPSQSDVYFYYQQKQSAPAMASVTVHYYDTKGHEIAPAQTVNLEPGKHVLKPDSSKIPQGYKLTTEESIPVEVFENGTFSPQEIAFYYSSADEQKATITVYFRDDRGKDVATAKTMKLGDGVHQVKAEPDDLQAGYTLFPGMDSTAEVIVRNGTTTTSKVVFYYQKTVNEPTWFTIPVYYKDTLGNQIAQAQSVTVQPGNNYSVIANPENLPAGAELRMDDTLPFSVLEDGTTIPEELAFYYYVPKGASVTVTYADDQNRPIIEPFTVKLAAGNHLIQADAARVPSGYDASSAKSVQVRVNSSGEAEPKQVVLVFQRQVVETPIPVGEMVNRYATVNGSDVAFRNEPTQSGGNKTVIKRLSKNSKVFVLQEMYNSKNEVWAMVNVDGRIGYMMSSFLDVMTQQKSDEYAMGSTPVPTFTPEPAPTDVPTATPTASPTATPLVERFTPEPSHTPTLEPLPTETASPTPTASPEPYTGYALTTRATALRTGVSDSDMTVILSLEANELVHVINQVTDPVTGEIWSIVSTLSNQPGFVQHSALRPITDREAQPYIDYWQEINKTPEPTKLVTATPEPPQMQGYGVVIGDGVPFRQMESEMSRIIDVLDANTVVYVTGQTPGDGQYWHSVNYEGHWGYIRSDLVRMMTVAEEEEYIESQRATPTPATTNRPFDENGLSSYGYVDGSSVNWRETPSTGGKRIGELKRYAFCLVLGSEHVNGVTWYEVRYGDKSGYIHGDFFRQMTISELESFLGSDEYLQGIANNSASGESAKDDVGFTGTGGIVSEEDKWVNSNPDLYVTFAPFNPIGTVAPIATGTPTLEPLPGWMTDAPTATPTATPTFNPLPDVTYPTTDDGEGGSAILWAVVIGLLLLAVGGVFALVRYNQNRRRIAMRAAQRRAQAARAQQQHPYARTADPAQPRTGMYQQQPAARRPSAPQNPAANQPDSPYAPYTGMQSYQGGNFRRPQEEDGNEGVTPSNTQRVGRRTAYRQAQEAARQAQESDDLNM